MLYSENEGKPQITLLISTTNERIAHLCDSMLPPTTEIAYVVSWQNTSSISACIPSQLKKRKDTLLTECKKPGLSENRNNALRHAPHDGIVLICDDDCKYTLDGLRMVVTAFNNYPNADILLFQGLDLDGVPLKKYPSQSFCYENRPKGYYASSLEIAFRNTSKIPLFDIRFGLGSQFLACGEEEIFLFQAQQNGCIIRYVPFPIVQTDSSTTGTHFVNNSAVRRSKGAVYAVVYGYRRALLEIAKFAILHTPKNLSSIRAFIDMKQGLEYIIKK